MHNGSSDDSKRGSMHRGALNNNSMRRYLIKVQMCVGLVVVVSYTLLLNWYFVRGLDESNFMNMSLEVSSFREAYERGESPPLPRSVHFNGYLDWQQLSPWLRQEFSELEQVSSSQRRILKRHPEGQLFGRPDEVVFFMAEPLADGKIFYLLRRINKEQHKQQSGDRIKSLLSLTWPLALGFLLLSLASVYVILRKLTQPLQRLGDWADGLTLANIGKAPADFGFNELNRLARQQQEAFNRIGEVLEKEQNFLKHASHELRTPIAVIKGNSELLGRLLQQQVQVEAGVKEGAVNGAAKGAEAVARIQRASLNMQQLTETLLWLSREDPSQECADAVSANGQDSAPLAIHKLIEQLIEDNQYLLQGKQVLLSLQLNEQMLNLSETTCRLTLSNLIRNAFQYTAEGHVSIRYDSGRVVIENYNLNGAEGAEGAEAASSLDNADYGYGLGLRLVERIVAKMGWGYDNQLLMGGRRVTVSFLK